MTERNRGDPNEPERVRRARPHAAHLWGEEIWRLVHETGDAGAQRDYLLEVGGMTPSQFERGKGFIRDLKALSEREAFLAIQGVYLTTTDTNRCAQYIGLRLRGIDSELRRMRSGVLLPLGDSIQNDLVLAYYHEEISHMLKAVERLRALSYPVATMPQ